MSVVPAGNEAAHTTATSWPLVASETFALVRPATASVFAGVTGETVCAVAAAYMNPQASVAGTSIRVANLSAMDIS
jgi:hypothetical protein